MKIGLILTGGTLDSVATEHGLEARIGSGFADALRRLLAPGQTLQEVPSPWRIDSSQLETSMIHSLGTSVLQAPAQDAWILVAGTDTLAWLAPSLWWMLGSLGVPVFLVCGMAPWWVPGGDGEASLSALPALLAQTQLPGVHVVSNARILPPCGLHKISHLVRDPFRPLTELRTTPTLEGLFGRLSSPTIPFPRAPYPPPFPRQAWLRAPSVLWLPLHPGLDPRALVNGLNAEPPRHVVLGSYSGGTLPLTALEEFASMSTSLHLISQQWGPLELGGYAVSSGLAERLLGWNLGPETVTALLALADGMGLEKEDALRPLRTLEVWAKA